MYRHTTFIFFLFFSILSSAQGSFINLKTDLENLKQVFNVTDESTSKIGIFLQDKKKILGYLMTSKMDEIEVVEASDIPNKYNSFDGYLIEENKITLFSFNNRLSKYCRLIFNFKTQTSTFEEFELNIGKEHRLGIKNTTQTMLLLTIEKNSNKLFVYEFGTEKNVRKHAVDISDTYFISRYGKKENLYNFLSESDIFYSTINPSEIESNVPIAIETASRKLKFYCDKQDIVLTIDENVSYTYILKIKLSNFRVTVDKIEKPQLGNERNIPKTNSFLTQNELLQISATPDSLKIQVVKLDSKEKIFIRELSKNDTLSFKNTAIIQEGGAYENYRELGRTTQFLRKMRLGNVGISGYKQNDNYVITLGGALEAKQGYGLMGNSMTVGSAMGAMNSGLTPGFNSMNTAYLEYGNSRSVRITGYFNSDFEHLEGDIPKTGFDKIKAFSEKQKGFTNETIFKIDSNFYWGSWYPDQKTFRLVKLRN